MVFSNLTFWWRSYLMALALPQSIYISDSWCTPQMGKHLQDTEIAENQVSSGYIPALVEPDLRRLPVVIGKFHTVRGKSRK